MSWWQQRKARKALEKHNIPGLDVKALQSELNSGHNKAKQTRSESRKKESHEYRKLIGIINQIAAGKAAYQQKKNLSYRLVRSAPISDYEKQDLLDQLALLYE